MFLVSLFCFFDRFSGRAAVASLLLCTCVFILRDIQLIVEKIQEIGSFKAISFKQVGFPSYYSHFF